MSDGERMIFATAFVAALVKQDYNDRSQSMINDCATIAYTAVLAIRNVENRAGFELQYDVMSNRYDPYAMHQSLAWHQDQIQRRIRVSRL